MAPDFYIDYVDGVSARLSDYRGSVVMLQFTASWCRVCREEMPHIESEIWQVYKDKGLKVIGIDRDEPGGTVMEFARKMKVTYPLALDPGAEIFALFALRESGVTRNVVIDRDGKIVFLTRLFKRDEFEEMKDVIEERLSAIDN
jgi:peroxiredoxin